jgi:ATP-dependent DNA ligase
MRRQFIKQVGLGVLGISLMPKLVFSNDKIIKGMRKKPMLAQNVGDYSRIKSDDWPLYVQPKLDGVRCLIQAEQIDHFSRPIKYVVKAYSRTGKQWKNIDHILEELKPFFEKHPYVILDGELYNHELKNDFEKIISLVRKTKPTDEDRLESSEMVEFHCYDIINEDWNFEDRNLFINENFGVYGKFELSTVVPTPSYLVNDIEEVEVSHEDFLEMGYEGSILRQNKPYECKRSWTLMKVKDFSDAEATIIGYEEGKGKREGHLGKFIMEDDNGVQFGCPPGKGYTYDIMKDMLENIHDYIGERATFTYFERTKAGSYRHPLFKGLRNYE